MKTICVKPVLVDGKPARVLDPATSPPSPLPAWGKEVAHDTYWRRRLAAREVEETTAAAIEKARLAAAAKAAEADQAESKSTKKKDA